MAITIGNGSIVFSDGSGYAGTVSGAIATDTSSGTTTSSFNVGHLVFVQTIFPENGPGYEAYPRWYPLNAADSYYSNPGGASYVGSLPIYYNALNANNTTNFGSQHYYSYSVTNGGATPSHQLAGTWKGRGNARGRGINQGYLNGVIAERVA